MHGSPSTTHMHNKISFGSRKIFSKSLNQVQQKGPVHYSRCWSLMIIIHSEFGFNDELKRTLWNHCSINKHALEQCSWPSTTHDNKTNFCATLWALCESLCIGLVFCGFVYYIKSSRSRCLVLNCHEIRYWSTRQRIVTWKDALDSNFFFRGLNILKSLWHTIMRSYNLSDDFCVLFSSIFKIFHNINIQVQNQL